MFKRKIHNYLAIINKLHLMNIAINTRLLIENELEGIGRFSFEIVKRIVKKYPNIHFHLIFDRSYSKKFLFAKNVKGHIIYPKTRHPIIWYYWFEIQMPKLLNKINADLFISLDGFLPTKIKIPKITVIHDINFEHRPKDLPFFYRKYYKYYFPKYCQLAEKIITVSKFSKNDIIEKYNIKKDKISVVYNGVSDAFLSKNINNHPELKKQYSSGEDYFIFIGSLHKRKNISTMLKSFDLFKKITQSKTKFLIVGKKRWWSNTMEKIYNNMLYKTDVIFTGYVDDNSLPMLISGAKCLCFISLFEGFGLPIIEAMKCNTPVITSNTSAMPEICKNAGLIVNPKDIKDISNAMKKIDQDQLLRKKLTQYGRERVKAFNWEKSADDFSKIIEDLITI